MDFVTDTLAHGRGHSALTIVDHHSRECVAIEVATSLLEHRVTRVLDAMRGLTEMMTQRSQLTSRCVMAWCEVHEVQHLKIYNLLAKNLRR